MKVRTNINNMDAAFTLATNVDCGLHIIRPFSNLVFVGIVEQNLSYV